MTASWDDASRCPRHELKGAEQSSRPMKHGEQRGTLVTLTCPQETCEYYDAGWVVQIRPDGTIPDARQSHDKSFDPLPGWKRERGRDIVQDLREEIALSQIPGGYRLGDGERGRRHFT
jgi:hypothetical protein